MTTEHGVRVEKEDATLGSGTHSGDHHLEFEQRTCGARRIGRRLVAEEISWLSWRPKAARAASLRDMALAAQ